MMENISQLQTMTYKGELIMGIYFNVIFVNPRTQETTSIEVFSLGDYETAWEQAVQDAMKYFKELWSVEGNNKYWVIKSIEDITRR